MKQIKRMFLGTLGLAVVCAMSATGQEKKLQKSDLPAAVQKTADEQSKGATVKGYAREMEHGKLQYEVELMVNNHSKDVTMSPDGSVLEVEEQVSLDALPAAVREGLQKKAGAGKITKVESLTKNNVLVAYEAQVHTGTKRSEVQVGPDGRALAHPE
jgi:predicted outer membrane protein